MAPLVLHLSDDFEDPSTTFTPAPSKSPIAFGPASEPAPAGHNRSQPSPQHPRTLLLGPPSLAAHEERLAALFSPPAPGATARFSRDTSDLHMLDRLASGLGTLPSSTYDLVLVLTGPDSAMRSEALSLLGDRNLWARIVPAMRPGAEVRFEDGRRLGAAEQDVRREVVLAGLVAAAVAGVDADEGAGAVEFIKPEYEEEEVVPLRLGSKNKTIKQPGNSTLEDWNRNGHANGGSNGAVVNTQMNGDGPVAASNIVSQPTVPAGVGFVDLSDDLGFDLDDEEDEDLIDEDALLTAEDMERPIQQPPECLPKPGRKRRACKDCTCGLAERLEAKDKARREKADKGLAALMLKSEDLNELDFTVQGKTGSCGSCALGDAFRCTDCPYIGLPPFKPGEEIKILNNQAQL